MSALSYIKNKIDLVDYIISKNVPLKKMGSNYRGKCPICNGNNNTELVVNSNYYYCHKCHAGGNVVKFVQDTQNVPYHVALKTLALELNYNLDSDKEYKEELKESQEVSHIIKRGMQNLPAVVDYLTSERGLNTSTIKEFQLGAETNGDVFIPIHDLYDRAVSFCMRCFGKNSPKYNNRWNSCIYDKTNSLFNLNRAIKRSNKTMYLCEGYFDCMSGHEQGLSIVAYNFSEISKDQIKLLKNTCVNPETVMVICPDNDDAGMKHIASVRKNFMDIAPRFLVKVLRMPDDIFEFCDVNLGTVNRRKCKDLNDLHLQGVSISKLETVHIDQFVLEQILSRNTDTQSQYVEVGEYIKTVKNPMVRADLAKFLAEYWNQDVLEIKKWFSVAQNDVKNDFIFKTVSQSLSEMETDAQIGYYDLGYPTLDSSIGGVRKKDVVLIGAYPSTGKTFVAGQYAHHCAVDLGLNVLFFSIEMPASALIERIGACHMNLPTSKVLEFAKSGQMSCMYNSVKGKLEKHLRIVDCAVGFDDIDSIIKRANATEFDSPVDVVIVDYIQILSNIRTFEDLEYTAKRFKSLAKENNVIFYALSQLSRGTETWVKPVMSKLKGGGSLESSGDIICMLYKKGDDPNLSISDKQRLQNVVTCSIEKCRRGYSVKEVDLLINKNTTTIKEV